MKIDLLSRQRSLLSILIDIGEYSLWPSALILIPAWFAFAIFLGLAIDISAKRRRPRIIANLDLGDRRNSVTIERVPHRLAFLSQQPTMLGTIDLTWLRHDGVMIATAGGLTGFVYGFIIFNLSVAMTLGLLFAAVLWASHLGARTEIRALASSASHENSGRLGGATAWGVGLAIPCFAILIFLLSIGYLSDDGAPLSAALATAADGIVDRFFAMAEPDRYSLESQLRGYGFADRILVLRFMSASAWILLSIYMAIAVVASGMRMIEWCYYQLRKKGPISEGRIAFLLFDIAMFNYLAFLAYRLSRKVIFLGPSQADGVLISDMAYGGYFFVASFMYFGFVLATIFIVVSLSIRFSQSFGR